ncbi:hypothetical protein BH24DEI2_BH24DEI2_23480 [soil metagenome]
MKRPFVLLALATLFGGAALAQVSSADILGVDETRPHSETGTALFADDSTGEVTVRVRALDANGDPVAGAPVSWTLSNRTSALAYVVGSSAESGVLLVFGSSELPLEGGATDANGEAYLTIDAQSAGDVSLAVTVGGVDAKAYDGNNLRVVWF